MPDQREDWKKFLESFPEAHILQTAEWGQLKSAFGWRVAWVITDEGRKIGAQILLRRFFPGFTMAYIPKGPVYPSTGAFHESEWNIFWETVDQFCRSRRIAFLKVEPDYWIKREPMNKEGSGLASENQPSVNTLLAKAPIPLTGCIPSSHVIQPLRTIILDLRLDEEALLYQMKPKTRYNIKLALKHGVVVRPSNDVEKFYQLMTITGKRDQFGIHSLDYYQTAFDLFDSQNACQLFFAEHQSDILAGLMVFKHGARAWYFYGASSNLKREIMPTYALQWEAIRWARRQGCLEYDLWGVPDFDLNYLEENFTNRRDQLWGVYRFKRGFGGELRRAAGAWDRVYNPLLYALYRWWTRRASQSAPAHL